MEFATADFGAALLNELKVASRASVAVAYFNPDDTILSALKKIPQLRLLVADDFHINNPYKLESLCRRGVWVRAVPVDSSAGKLHSKVFLIRRKDGSRWAMVGSANLTRAGLYSNQEACVILDSKQQGDDVHLRQIKDWLDEIGNEDPPEIDFEVAKAVYETRAKYKTTPANCGSTPTDSPLKTGGYWALKPGWGGEYWQNFLGENVIALGWGEMSGNPSTMSPEEVERAYRAAWSDDSNGKVNTNVAQIIKFTQSMNDGDLVLICGRYDGTALGKTKDAFIYGVARATRIDGQSFLNDKKSSWFRFKRRATIQPIGERIPRDMIARALGKGAFVPTIQSIDQEGFERLANVLRAEFGIAINV